MLNCWYTRTVEFETGVSLVGLFGSFAVLAGLLIHHRAETFLIITSQLDRTTFSPGVHSVGVHGVEISLVEVDEENHIVPEASHSVCCGHGDDEGKQIVDKCIECLVHESLPRKRQMKWEGGQYFRE